MIQIISDLPIIAGVVAIFVLWLMRKHYVKKEEIQENQKMEKLIADTVQKTLDAMGIREMIKNLPDNISDAIKQAYKEG